MFRLVPMVCAAALLTASGFSAIVITAKHDRFPGVPMGGIIAGIGTDGPVFDNRLAQIFYAQNTGYLQDVSFAAWMSTFSPTTVPLRLDVTALATGGVPGEILATQYVPVGQFTTSSPSEGLNISVSFAGSNVELLAGRSYALVFRTDTVEANYRIGMGDYPGYFNGSMMRSQNSPMYTPAGNSDVYFQVRVNAVPEPSALAVAGFGGILLCSIRRRSLEQGERRASA